MVPCLAWPCLPHKYVVALCPFQVQWMNIKPCYHKLGMVIEGNEEQGVTACQSSGKGFLVVPGRAEPVFATVSEHPRRT
jgi:hypothetical protein